MFARLMGLKTISAKERHKLMQEQPVSVVDVNSEEMYSLSATAESRSRTHSERIGLRAAIVR